MNKKIKNAHKNSAFGLHFKSLLEKHIFEILSEQGFDPKYEPKTFVLWEGFKSVTPFYDEETISQRNKRDSKSPKILVKKSPLVQPIKYTPDIYFRYKDIDIWIEAKGMENDVFYIKKKMFRKYLDASKKKSLYFEIHTKKQLCQAIDIVKSYG